MENINDLMPLSNDWNKERLTQLKNLFPDLFTNEGKLSIDELKKVIDPLSISEIERFEFRWFGKSAAKRNAYTPSNATLIYDEHRSVNPTESENIIIEGENLEVLKLLSTAYREQIKCIYIDPPYNTGKDFVYSDNFTEDKKPYWEQTGVTENGVKIDTNADSDGRYHSNWLNMMFSRLLIARQLLREDGVIFISIDDNEVHHLRKICDEVFGEKNFVGELPRITKKGGKSSEHFAKNNDYIVCYQKSDEGQLNSFDHIDDGFKHQDEWVEERGIYKLNQTLDYGSIQYSASLDYEIEIDGAIYRPGSVTKDEMAARKLRNPKSDFCWRWSKDLFEFGYKNGFIVVKENGSNRVYTKTYQNATIEKNEKGYFIDYKQRTKSISSIDLLDNEFSNDNSKKDLVGILNEAVFEYSKPVSLVKKLALLGMNENDVFLDFFGGSGTSGQAIIELNKDGGNRKFILVQIPEATDESNAAYKAGYKKISDITIERNKRVVEKLIEEKKKPSLFTNGDKKAETQGLGFKVFKLAKSSFPRVEWAPDVDKTDEENIVSLKQYIDEKEAQLKTLFNQDELLTEILLKNGYQLNYTVVKQTEFEKNDIFLATDGIKTTLICLDGVIDMDTVTYFKKHTDKKFICLERALDTTKKYNLKHYLGGLFNAF
jgi:adenine-specific DNA-methyltransferase